MLDCENGVAAFKLVVTREKALGFVGRQAVVAAACLEASSSAIEHEGALASLQAEVSQAGPHLFSLRCHTSAGAAVEGASRRSGGWTNATNANRFRSIYPRLPSPCSVKRSCRPRLQRSGNQELVIVLRVDLCDLSTWREQLELICQAELHKKLADAEACLRHAL